MQDRCQNTDRKSEDNERNGEKGRGYLRSIQFKSLIFYFYSARTLKGSEETLNINDVAKYFYFK